MVFAWDAWNSEHVKKHFSVESAERTECLGECPVYTAIITSDGIVRFDGRMYVRRTGKDTGRVDPRRFENLARFIHESRYMALADSYHMSALDAPYVYTTVVEGGVRKVIADFAPDDDAFDGQSPPNLWVVERLIDKLLAETRWDD